MAVVKDLNVERFQDLYSKNNINTGISHIGSSDIEFEQKMDFVKSASATPLPEANDELEQMATISLTTLDAERRQILNVQSMHDD